MREDRRARHQPLRHPLRRHPLRLGLAATSLALLAVLAIGCGKKGEPEPPIRLLPAKGKNLVARQQGGDAVLSVGYPKTAVNGMALPGLDGVEIWWMPRPTTPEGKAPDTREAEFRAASKRLLTLSGSDLQSSIAGDRILTRMPLPDAQDVADFAHVWSVIFVSSEGERSAFSNIASLVAITPPMAPTELELEARAGGVEIRWAAPADEPKQYRGLSPCSLREGLRRAPGEAQETEHLDSTATFGARYIYSVTALSDDKPPIESATAAEAEITYRDRFAPPAPEGLVALAEPARVRLRWRASTVGDLAAITSTAAPRARASSVA